MAQDTRPYKSKEKDKNGNEVILRDQQLIEQTSHTTMASTEYFEIVDADGRQAKIPKDNMMGIVKECMGTILSGNDAEIGTDLTKIVTLKNSDLGATTKTNLSDALNVNRGVVNVGSFDIVRIEPNREGTCDRSFICTLHTGAYNTIILIGVGIANGVISTCEAKYLMNLSGLTGIKVYRDSYYIYIARDGVYKSAIGLFKQSALTLGAVSSLPAGVTEVTIS